MLSLSTLFAGTEALHQKRHFVIAADPDYAPFTFKDSQGHAAGLLIDLWNTWAVINGYDVTYRFGDWDVTLEDTRNGKADFHSGTTKDYKWMYASDPIYEIKSALYALYDSPIETAEELKNKRIGSIDEYYGKVAQKACGGECKLMLFETYAEMIDAIERGKVDVMIDDVDALTYYFIKHGKLAKFKKLEQIDLHNDSIIYAITNQSHSSLLPLINEGLKKIPKKRLLAIERRWLPNIDTAYYHQKFVLKPKNEYAKWWEAFFALLILGLLAYMFKLKHAQKEVYIDDLTGIYNKKALEEHFHKKAQTVGMLFIDVDHFKGYNDIYGHLKGDRVLRRIGDVLKTYKDKKLLPYRIGGDEFAMIMYDYDRDSVLALCKTLLQEIRALRIRHHGNPPGIVTVSIGASVGDIAIDREKLYHCADKVLYLAKEKGRDRFEYQDCARDVS